MKKKRRGKQQKKNHKIHKNEREEKKVWSAYQHKIGSTKIKQKKEDFSCIMVEEREDNPSYRTAEEGKKENYRTLKLIGYNGKFFEVFFEL